MITDRTDYTGQDLSGRDPSEFPDTITGSNFAQETPNSNAFPSMTGKTFIDCNLDNVTVPGGNVLINSPNRRIEKQNDQEDWICDSGGNPLEPITKKAFIELGISIDPADIPISPTSEPIVTTKQREQTEAE